jgi:hypothetical protein
MAESTTPEEDPVDHQFYRVLTVIDTVLHNNKDLAPVIAAVLVEVQRMRAPEAELFYKAMAAICPGDVLVNDAACKVLGILRIQNGDDQ